jgi:hypothetical protein
MPHGIRAHSKAFYLINYLKHCISYTAVQTNEADFIGKFGVANKEFRLQRIKCVGWFVFVFLRTKHLNYCGRPGAEGDICFEDRGSSRGMNKITH